MTAKYRPLYCHFFYFILFYSSTQKRQADKINEKQINNRLDVIFKLSNCMIQVFCPAARVIMTNNNRHEVIFKQSDCVTQVIHRCCWTKSELTFKAYSVHSSFFKGQGQGSGAYLKQQHNFLAIKWLIKLCLMLDQDSFRLIVVYFDSLWLIVVHCGTLWLIVAHCVIQFIP